MKHSPSYADSRSASQEICFVVYNPKVYHRAHKSPPTIPILNQMNPVHAVPQLNVIFRSTPRCSELPLPFRPSNQMFAHISYFATLTTCLAYHILLDLITLITFGEKTNYGAPHPEIFPSFLACCTLESNILVSFTSSNTFKGYYSIRQCFPTGVP
jgi:hypothetical protein